MKTKIISVITALAMSAVCLVSCGESCADSPSSRAESSVSVTAATTTKQTTTEQTTTTTVQTTTVTQPQPKPSLPAAKACVLYCADDDEYLYAHNMDRKISIASTTKLLTAALAVKYLDPNTMITVGGEIAFIKPESTVAQLWTGQRLTAEQLLYGLILPSGNDAAYVVAVNVARAANPGKTLTDEQAVSTFVGMMNSYAAQIGMTSSHFANPEGWDDEMHYSTLSDMLKLTRHALGIPLIASVVSTHYKTVQCASGDTVSWMNTNELLDPNNANYVPEAIGVKTGTTEDAGCCVIAAVKHGGKTYYCAAMGCNEHNDRYTVVRKLLAWYFKQDNKTAA